MIVVTIDGPAGAGKSTVSRRLAETLTERTSTPFEYLDTGSMYRAVALLGIRNDVDWNDAGRLEALAAAAKIDVDAGRTFLDDRNVTDAVRSAEVTAKTRFAADNPAIRRRMVELQRDVAARWLREGKGLVAEGRDQGTVVFPEAQCKFFLTATPEERARRRCSEMLQRGEGGDFDDILNGIVERDRRDSRREVGPLRRPDDAVEIISDGQSVDEVVDRLVRIVCAALGEKKSK